MNVSVPVGTGSSSQKATDTLRVVTYRPVRPTFDTPTLVRRDDVALQVWGDEESGEVADAIYISNEKIHLMVFTMPPGGGFTHSAEFRTVFDGDERVLVGVHVSTERMTVGTIYLHPGQRSALQLHKGDKCVFMFDGEAGVRLPENEGQTWFELQPEDGLYIPQGTPHRYHNFS